MDTHVKNEPGILLVDEARNRILSGIVTTDKEHVSMENALGRIIASAVLSNADIPHFRKSPFDGYCLNSDSLRGASAENPIRLRVHGVLRAGGPSMSAVEGGTLKIMTGAEVPDGYDCVIKKEDTDLGEDVVTIFKSARPGDNVVQVGEDVRKGDFIVDAGTRIHPGTIAMLSALGITELQVYKKPRVSLITTGDELIESEQELVKGRVYNSNRYALMAYLTALGMEPTYYGTGEDDPVRLTDLFLRALDGADLLITTGGVSVGDFDYVRHVYEKAGIQELFWGVRMKPGTPVMAGRYGKKTIISLPGTPAASLVAFEVIAVPALRKMRGSRNPIKKIHFGCLDDGFEKVTDLPRYLRVSTRVEPDGYHLELTGKQNASVLHSMMTSDALATARNLGEKVERGDSLEFTFLGDED